ncbi:MAG: hypothetical protein IAE78_03975 [Myxococcus sp.]|nr:hypothetical protein [Myxococcus sp.]
MVPVMLDAAAPVAGLSPRASVVLGLGAAAGLWLAPTPLFLVAWVAFFGWLLARVARSRHLLSAALVGVAGLLPGVTWALGIDAGPLPPVAVMVAGGVLPFHLWFTALEHRLRPSELQVVLVAQPGVAFLHRWVTEHHDHLPGQRWVLAGFVVTALAQTGLGLVRASPRRALTALTLSQSALLLAGAVAHEAGWQAARLLWLSLAAGAVVLHSVAHELERKYGATTLAPAHGLAAAEPMLHRAFVGMGWLFVGLPGGVAFFAEDLLFHALVETSVAATFAFLGSVALNAVVFYRVYLGLFAGPARRPAVTPPSRRGAWVYLALLAVVVAGGLCPQLFLRAP